MGGAPPRQPLSRPGGGRLAQAGDGSGPRSTLACGARRQARQPGSRVARVLGAGRHLHAGIRGFVPAALVRGSLRGALVLGCGRGRRRQHQGWVGTAALVPAPLRQQVERDAAWITCGRDSEVDRRLFVGGVCSNFGVVHLGGREKGGSPTPAELGPIDWQRRGSGAAACHGAGAEGSTGGAGHGGAGEVRAMCTPRARGFSGGSAAAARGLPRRGHGTRPRRWR